MRLHEHGVFKSASRQEIKHRRDALAILIFQGSSRMVLLLFLPAICFVVEIAISESAPGSCSEQSIQARLAVSM